MSENGKVIFTDKRLEQALEGVRASREEATKFATDPQGCEDVKVDATRHFWQDGSKVREFSIRRGSGGDGLHRGGDGVIRRLEFLRPLQLSILSQRRGPYAPYGLAGGSEVYSGNPTPLK